MTQISQDTYFFIQMAVYYFIITNVRYGTTTSDTTCTRINNDCSGWTTWLYRYKKKKKKKSRSPRPRLNTNKAFFIPPFLEISLHWHILTESETQKNLQAYINGYPKTRFMWHQGTEDLSLLKMLERVIPVLAGLTHHHHLWGRQERRNACYVFKQGQLSWSPCHL